MSGRINVIYSYHLQLAVSHVGYGLLHPVQTRSRQDTRNVDKRYCALTVRKTCTTVAALISILVLLLVASANADHFIASLSFLAAPCCMMQLVFKFYRTCRTLVLWRNANLMMKIADIGA